MESNVICFLAIFFSYIDLTFAEKIEEKIITIDREKIFVDRLKNNEKFKEKSAFHNKSKFEIPSPKEKSNFSSESTDFPYSKFCRFRLDSFHHDHQKNKNYYPEMKSTAKKGKEMEIKKFLKTDKN